MSDDIDAEIGDAVRGARSGGGGKKKGSKKKKDEWADLTPAQIQERLIAIAVEGAKLKQRADAGVKAHEGQMALARAGAEMLGIPMGDAPTAAHRRPELDGGRPEDIVWMEYTDDQLVAYYRDNHEYPSNALMDATQVNRIASRVAEIDRNRGRRWRRR